MYCFAAAASGFIPIGVLDSPFLFSLEFAMVIQITVIYNNKLKNEERNIKAKDFMKSITANFAIGVGAFVLGSIPLLIPGLGLLVSSIICSGISFTACFAIGKKCIDFFTKEVKKNGLKVYMMNLVECFNDAINGFNEISNNILS